MCSVLVPHLLRDAIAYVIVEFLQHQKLTWRQGVGDSGVFGLLPPPQPELSIRGRSACSLLRLVDEWHEQRGRRDARLVTWEPAPFRPLQWVETRWQPQVEDRVWTLTELCSSHALAIEGRTLRHCASSYVAKCASGRSSLWSLQVETRTGTRRVATVEVDLSTRSIVQARGKCNRSPSAADKTLIRRWAEREGIDVAPALRDLQ